MIDIHNNKYNRIKEEIDRVIKLGSENVEVKKGEILKANNSYINFIKNITKSDVYSINETIDECSNWLSLDLDIQKSFELLSEHNNHGIDTCEIRVHSYTFYLIVRLLKPDYIIETGVANGKSSLIMLEALSRNNNGHLISIDMAMKSEDGKDKYKAEGMDIGWLVPSRLHDRWDLRIGKSDEILPQLTDLDNTVDIFFHDSLSNYENMTYEYGQATRLLTDGGLLISDDITACSAFEEFVDLYCHTINCFGTLGTAFINPK